VFLKINGYHSRFYTIIAKIGYGSTGTLVFTTMATGNTIIGVDNQGAIIFQRINPMRTKIVAD
jgi:hypothetical protein